MADTTFQTPVSQLIAYGTKQLKRLSANLERIFADAEVEAVHDVRVASRRLAAVLRIMGSLIGVRKTSKLVRRLRRLRRAFRRLRDLDVVQESLGRDAPIPLDATALAHLEGVLTRRREQLLRRVRRTAERADLGLLAARVQEVFRQCEAAFEDGSDDAVRLLTGEAVARWSARLAKLDPRTPGTHLHETRLCVKRLRYAAELAREVEGRKEDALVSALARMQEVLGEWNDHLVAVMIISKIARRACLRGEDPLWAAKILNYAALRAEAAEQLRPRVLQAWTTLPMGGQAPTELPTHAGEAETAGESV